MRASALGHGAWPRRCPASRAFRLNRKTGPTKSPPPGSPWTGHSRPAASRADGAGLSFLPRRPLAKPQAPSSQPCPWDRAGIRAEETPGPEALGHRTVVARLTRPNRTAQAFMPKRSERKRPTPKPWRTPRLLPPAKSPGPGGASWHFVGQETWPMNLAGRRPVSDPRGSCPISGARSQGNRLEAIPSGVEGRQTAGLSRRCGCRGDDGCPCRAARRWRGA